MQRLCFFFIILAQTDKVRKILLIVGGGLLGTFVAVAHLVSTEFQKVSVWCAILKNGMIREPD